MRYEYKVQYKVSFVRQMYINKVSFLCSLHGIAILWMEGLVNTIVMIYR